MYMNTPYYGILQATLKWNGSIGPHDVLCVGHFHQTAMFSINNTTILLNGSAYAQDNFVLKNLKVKTDTRFWMFGVSDKRPITWSYRVDINGFEKPKEDVECQKIAVKEGQS
jgi:stringent starvation protein B